jgi:hypothetical protein
MRTVIRTYVPWNESSGNGGSAIWDYAWQTPWCRRIESEGLIKADEHESKLVHRSECDLLGILERRSDLYSYLIEYFAVR